MKNKAIRKSLMYVMSIHIIVSLTYVLFFNLKYPFPAFFSQMGSFMQVVFASLIAFAIYFIGTYLFLVGIDFNEDKLQEMDKALLIFSLLMLLFYLYPSFDFLINGNHKVWKFYLIVQPIFSSFMIELVPKGIFSLSWLLSVFIPGLAMGTAMTLAFKE